MNKLIIPMYFLYLFLFALVCESLLFTINGGEIVLSSYTFTEDTGLTAVWNFLTFLFSLFAFSVEGLPVFVNIVFIYIPTLTVISSYIIPLIRGIS